MGKLKVLYFLHQYPQLSQTYVENEIRALGDDYDVTIVAANPADATYKNHLPYRLMPRGQGLPELVLREKFDVLHCHWTLPASFLARVAQATKTPFTVRAHSFESYVPEHKPPPRHLVDSAQGINSELCLKVFCLPFTRRSLERVGIKSDKLEDYLPLVDYPRFLNREPNGEAVMNLGACTPKKKMEDFIDLAAELRDSREFNLYAVAAAGREIDRVKDYNRQKGAPVQIRDAVEPEEMPHEYKKHQWLVYTACPQINQVGWPLSIAEAQASGVGVCMPEIRPDVREYIGDAGVIYRDIREVASLITEPVPESLRERGFAHAERCDLKYAVAALKQAWSKVSRPNA
jgi:glycosyltransferase involved in cell wall biosynthesis